MSRNFPIADRLADGTLPRDRLFFTDFSGIGRTYLPVQIFGWLFANLLPDSNSSREMKQHHLNVNAGADEVEASCDEDTFSCFAMLLQERPLYMVHNSM